MVLTYWGMGLHTPAVSSGRHPEWNAAELKDLFVRCSERRDVATAVHMTVER